jgi:hypothetical protein
VFIKFQLIVNKQSDDEKRSDADGHPDNIDSAEQLVLQ